jgi:hypothetical protein
MGLRRNIPKEANVRSTSFALRLQLSLDRLLTGADVAHVTIDVLPDVALLEIFDFFMDQFMTEAWHTLVHVCRKWRNIVFESPRHLNLQLFCKTKTPVRETLDVWPLLPIVVWSSDHEKWGVDNVIAALEHNDRICELRLLDIPSSQLEEVLATMQQPFPALTRLQLWPRDKTVPVIPDSILGGSAPRLRTLFLDSIPFPGLPKLLLSATHLVHLDLRRIPHSGYISPETMAICLSVLIRLENLFIGFESPRSRPDRKTPRLPLPTRALLPVLTDLWLNGVGEYLEDLVARINAPLLDNLDITFFHQLIFDTPQLRQFITRTPKLKALAHDEAFVDFSYRDVLVTLPQTSDGRQRRLHLGISCGPSDWQLSSLAQFCGSSFPQAFIPVEHLYIVEVKFPQMHWQDGIESIQWLELLHPFTAVKNLYISREFVPRIAPALQELVGETVAEVLPALQTLFLEEPLPLGPVQETIGQFVDARQLANHPVAVSHWERS